MYNLISTTKPTAKKEYDCIWCSEKILKGESHVKEVGNYDREFQSNRWHQECHDAAQLYFSENDETDFTPYDNERASKEEKLPNIKNKITDVLKPKPLTFNLNNNEYIKYINLVDRHRSVCKADSFKVSFTPTGIGSVIEVSCGSCKIYWDITDYGSW